ncbi:MAG: zinc ABC transporter substrate-binding protein [Acidobacteriota bacterium]
MSKKLTLLASLSLLLALGCAPAPPDSGAGNGPAQVVATTGMIADTAARIAGELAEVQGLMGPGVDPHLYKASESDVRTLSEADLILYNGLFLEGKMGDILVKLARDRPVVAISEVIPEEKRREPPELEGQYDPHIWFDVSLWTETVTPIADALVEILPEHEDLLRAQAEAVRQELVDLDAWVVGKIGELPEERRVLITAHDAFGYFGDRYGLEVIGIQGISTLAEAGLQDVDRVVDLVVERDIPAIFVESSVPRRTVEAVRAAADSRGHRVEIGGELFSDAMGAPGTPEGTYEGMVRHNVETVVGALGGPPDEALEDGADDAP